MHWQYEDDANRASWYTYPHPCPVQTHGLVENEWNDIKAVLPFPYLWTDVPVTTPITFRDQTRLAFGGSVFDAAGKGKGEIKWSRPKDGFHYLLCLPNIYDPNPSDLSLSPFMLKGKFNSVMATIDAYSKKGTKESVEGAERKGGYVGGIAMGRNIAKPGAGVKHLVRVTDQRGLSTVYEVVLYE